MLVEVWYISIKSRVFRSLPEGYFVPLEQLWEHGLLHLPLFKKHSPTTRQVGNSASMSCACLCSVLMCEPKRPSPINQAVHTIFYICYTSKAYFLTPALHWLLRVSRSRLLYLSVFHHLVPSPSKSCDQDLRRAPRYATDLISFLSGNAREAVRRTRR